MPLPSIFGRDKHDSSRANRLSTVSPTSPSSSGRPHISNPIAQSVQGTSRLDPRTTISLVPGPSSASPSPVSAHGSIGAGGVAAEAGGGVGGGPGNGGVGGTEDNTHHHLSSSSVSSNYNNHRLSTNLLGQQQQHTGGSNGGNSNNNGNGPSTNSSSSSAPSVTGAPATTTTRERRNPVSSLFSSGRERHHNHQQPPPSPDVSTSVSRRLSLRSHHISKSSSPAPSPLQQQHQYPPQPGQQQRDGNLDPYLQRPGSARASSVLATPHEEHSPNSLGIDQGQHPYQQQQQQQQQYGHPFQIHQNFSHASLLSLASHQQPQQQGQQHPQLVQQQQHPQQQQNQYFADAGSGQPQQAYPQEQAIPPDYQHQHQQHQLQHQQHHQHHHQHQQDDTMPRHSGESQSVQQQQQQQQVYPQRGNVQEAYNGSGATPNRGGQSYDPNQQQAERSTLDRNDSRAGNQSGQPSQSELNLQQVLDELTTLQHKYRKVKNLYFDRNAEIERLQNALAHQRLSQSRTSLDDHEYMSRFERLDGAIKNVAFEIRQSWTTIPAWLQPYINAGAQAKGGREMTLVGRASISRWVVDEILEAFFHPCLEAKLSAQLKDIEHHIRSNAPPPQTVEEDDAISAKVCNWRLTTLDAVQNQINGPQAAKNRQLLSEELITKLVTNLEHHLHKPAPAGLLKGCQMIVEIAIGLAANLPIESRDVRVWYPLPGEPFDTKFMKNEGVLPPLSNPSEADPNKMEVDSGDANSNSNTNTIPGQDTTNSNGPASSNTNNTDAGEAGKDDRPQSRAGIAGLPRKDKSGGSGGSGGVFGRARRALQGSQHQPSQQQQQQQQQQQPGQQSGQNQQAPQPSSPGANKTNDRKEPDKVRIAGFMAVEVRGKTILVKAPVWL